LIYERNLLIIGYYLAERVIDDEDAAREVEDTVKVLTKYSLIVICFVLL
jgi:hypothetical protein